MSYRHSCFSFVLPILCVLGGAACSEGSSQDSCFAAGTLIDTPVGPRPIESLREGDVVWSYDLRARQRIAAPISRTFVHRNALVRDLRLAGGSTLRVTDEHPFYVPGEGRYVPASELSVGVELASLDAGSLSETPVVSLSEQRKRTTVYNIEVAGFHNYFAEGTLVHNKSVQSPIMYRIDLNLDWYYRGLEIWLGGHLTCRGDSSSLPGDRELAARLIDLLEDEQRRLAYDADSAAFGSVPLVEVCLPGRRCFERTVFISGQGSSWVFMVQDEVTLRPETLALIDEIIEVHARCPRYEPRTVYGHPDCVAATDCNEGEVCDVYELRPKCVRLSCMSDKKRCPTGYVCVDLPDDECDPASGEACPGVCECRDVCPPEWCQNDRDCGYGSFCMGSTSKQCAQFDCMGGTALSWKCFCSDVEGCTDFLGAPPEDSVCVDDPRTVCEMATDPSCSGVCTPVPCAREGDARCEGRVVQVCNEGLWSASAFCEDGCESEPEPRCVTEPPPSQ